MDALRTATMAHGSTETNAMQADCIAAGSSGLAPAQAMLTGETYSCSQRNDRKASVARRSLRSLPATSSKTERSKSRTIWKKPPQRPPRCTGALRWKHQRRYLLACKRRRAVCCVHTVQVHEAGGPKPRPDVQHTPRGAAHAERSACASRGPTAAARCRPDGRAGPRRRRRARMMFGTGACGRGAPG